MKICAAQTRPVKGDIENNIYNHKKLVQLAISNGASIIIFPELSLTGYEPAMAALLATDYGDTRFDDLQNISNTGDIIIGAGMPIKGNNGTLIGMLIFQPGKLRQTYAKQYLHPDEYPYFVNGAEQPGVIVANNKIALAICYELSIPGHSEKAYRDGADIYVASVAKSVSGIEKAAENLSVIAAKYAMTVLMSNCVGRCDDFECGGKTSVWDNTGLLKGQLNSTDEGILIIDTSTDEPIAKIL